MCKRLRYEEVYCRLIHLRLKEFLDVHIYVFNMRIRVGIACWCDTMCLYVGWCCSWCGY